jgi:steroid delta-isomerase-like uncharacterized protein
VLALAPRGYKEVREGPGERTEEDMPTSDRHKALVRRWLEEVFSRGDLDAADGLFSSTYALHDPSFPRDVHGPEGIKRYVLVYRGAFPDLKVTVEDQLAEEDKVVTRWTARGTHSGEFLGLAPTRQEIEVSGIEFDRVISDRIDEAWVGYHPFAGARLDSRLLNRGPADMAEAFPDLRMSEADSVREGDKVAFRWLLSGTHSGTFMGIVATGMRVEAMGMDIVRVVDGEIAEHWTEFDVMGLLHQIGVVPRPGDGP